MEQGEKSGTSDSHREDNVKTDARKYNDEKGAVAAMRDWTPAEEKKILRKLDLRVFPMLCIVFGLSLLDRTNISFAYIAGMGEDLGLEIGSRYNIALL